MRHDVEEWIRARVEPAGAIELVHERAWSTVARVPVAGGVVWFKACEAAQRFEPRLTAALSSRWRERVPEVLAWDEPRAWLLLADAGSPLGFESDDVEPWLEVLPRYAELQIGEAAHAGEHLAAGVPDLRLDGLPGRYEELVARALPLEEAELRALRTFAPRFAELCAELAARGVPASIQHDDLHGGNVYGGRVLDWGDASVGHPFFSLVATYHNHGDRLPAARLRDAYLEPWRAEVETFELALRVGWFAYAVAWLRQSDHLPDEAARAEFAREFRNVLRLAYSTASA